MLPDIDAASWLDFQRKRASEEIDKRISGFGLSAAIDEKMSGLENFMGSMVGGPEVSAPQPSMPAPEPSLSGMAPAPEPSFGRQTAAPAYDRPAPEPTAMSRPAPQPSGGFFDQFTQPITDVMDRIRPAPEPTAVPQPTQPEPSMWQPPTIQGTASRPGGVNPTPSPDEVRAYITQAAQQRGIDPNIALRVANSEGGMEAARRGTFKTGSSWWPFQLHYGGKGYEHLGNVAGMGNTFTQQTGFQPGDPNAWQAATDYALDRAKESGWGAWYGAKAQGITGKMGIDKDTPVLGGIGQGIQKAFTDISQFGDPELTSEEAYAACGPAAAVRFAQRFGRNPSLREALDLAKTVGWTQQQGMAGLSSQQALMKKMGVETQLVPGAQWDRFAAEAQTGNPVTISTSAHYFYADGYNPETGAFHVGRSGTDLRGGKEWMTAGEIQAAAERLGGGNVQGALLANNPIVPGSTTSQPTGMLGQVGDFFSGLGSSVQSAITAQQQRIDETLTEMERGREQLGRDTQARLADLQSGFEGSNRRLRELMGETPEQAAAPTADYGNLGPSTAPGARYSPESILGELGTRVGDFNERLRAPVEEEQDFYRRAQAPSTGPGIAAGMSPVGPTVQRQWAGEEDAQLGPLNIPGRLAAPFGAAQELATELAPLTHVGRLYEGMAGELRRDPEYSAILNQMVDAQMTGDVTTRQALNDQLERRRQEVMAGAPTSAGEAYARGLASPERENVETIANLIGGVAAAGVAPQGLASGAGRFLSSLLIDPTGAPAAAAIEGLGPIARTVGRLRGAAPEAGQAAQLVEEGGPVVREALDDVVDAEVAEATARGLSGPVGDAVKAALARELDPAELADAQGVLDALPVNKRGETIGGLDSVNTAEDLVGIRRQLRALAQEGANQRNWYSDSSRAIMQAAGGNKADAEKIAQLVAIYSPNTPVSQNMDNAMTAWAQFKAGRPIDAPTLGANNKRASELLYGNKVWEGRKTNNFYRNLMQHIDPEVYTSLGKGQKVKQSGVTVDIWMMRALNSGRKAPSTQAQYEFAANEISRIADEMGWTPEQAQAAIWVAMKSGYEYAKKGLLPAASDYHYGTAMAERLARPLRAVDEAIDVALRDESGADILAREFGLLGADGRVSLSQARQSMTDPVTGKTVKMPGAIGAVQPEAKRAMDAYTAGRALLAGLPDAGWARVFKANNKRDANAYVVSAGRALDQTQLEELQTHLDSLVGPGKATVVPTDDGAWILNQSGGPNPAFHKASARALERLESVDAVTGTQARFDGNHFTNDWSTQTGGEAYRDIVRSSGFADRFARLEGVLAPKVEAARAAAGTAAPRDFGAGRLAAPDLPASAGILARGAAPLRTELGREALGGAVAGGYQAAQEEGATPEDVALGALGGSALGPARRALPGGSRLAPHLARVAEEVRPEVPSIFDGALPEKLNPLTELYVPGRERAAEGLSQILGPRGELLSTVTRRAEDVGGVARSLAGAEATEIPPTDPELLKRLPNLSKLAADMPDIQASLVANAQVNPELIDKFNRGVITHDMLVNDLAKRFGLSKEQYLKTPVGKVLTDPELLALQATVVEEGKKISTLTDEVAKQARERGGIAKVDSTKKAELVDTMLDAARLGAVVEGQTSGRGRSLNALKIKVTNALSGQIVTGIEARKAKEAHAKATKTAAEATSRAERADELVRRREQLAAERAEAIAAARQSRDQARSADLIKQINAAYDDLARYQNMSLAEKDEVWKARLEARDANALMRQEQLTEPEPLQGLLSALRKELDAEQKHFGKSRETWQDMAFWASKKDDILKTRSMQGQREWLKLQAREARKAASAAESASTREFRRLEAAEARTERVGEIMTERAEKMLKQIGSQEVTDDMLEQFIKLHQTNDPVAFGKFLRSVQKTSNWDRLDILRYASMLSSTATHTTQAISNAVNLGMRPLTTATAVPIDIARSKLTGSERERYWAEVPEMIKGMWEGQKVGREEALAALKYGVNVRQIGRNAEHVRPGFASGLGALDVAAEAPLRLMQASDLMFQGAARGMHSRGLATRQAIKEGFSGGEIGGRVQEIMENLPEFDHIMTEADQLARGVTLQEENIASRLPGGHWGRLISLAVPFVRTPLNIVAQGVGLTPAGLLNLARKDASASETIAKATIGTGLMGSAFMLAANDHLTAGYPADDWERSTLPAGWRPWSVKHRAADGTTTYVPYSSLGPVGIPLAIGAVAGEATRRGRPIDKTLQSAGMSLGRFMADQSMLQGFSNLLNVMTEPDRYGPEVLEGIAQQAMPYAGLQRQISNAMGIAPRDPDGAIEALLAAGLATQGLVKPKLTPLGDEAQPLMSGVGAFASPLRYGSGRDEPALEALRYAQVNIPEGAKTFRGIPLLPGEQRQQQTAAGSLIRQMVAEAQADPEWASLSRSEQQIVLERLVERARTAASAGVLEPVGEPGLEERYLAEQRRTAPVGR